LYRKYIFKRKYKRKLNLKKPTSFNEKIHYRILNDHNPIYTKLADKLLVRDYVREKIGEKYLIKLINHYNTPSEINFNTLPKSFVLKCNHDVGSVMIINDKSKINEKAIKKKLKIALKNNIYYQNREWHYKNIKPKIICEELINIFPHNKKNYPEDYKIHCFNGIPRYIELQFSRFSHDRRINIYDFNWNLQPFLMGYKNTNESIEKPKKLQEIYNISKTLSADFDYCRVDFYITPDDSIYFGELTFTPCNGMDDFYPNEWDYLFGKEWIIDDSRK
ncbi:TPA: glycosyltransferase, partial [Proteus mirabilis]|nr:glycosyltransferase [Proteus mirabilis]